MPVARIIANSSADVSALCEQLEREGYSVEFAAPGASGQGADLLIEAENVNVADALPRASELAGHDGTVVVAAGVVKAKSQPDPLAPSPIVAPPQTSEAPPPPAVERAEEEVNLRTGTEAVIGLFGTTATDVKSAFSESGEELRESLAEVKTRVGGVVEELKRKRELAAETRRVERERLELEKEERRREKEILDRQRREAEMAARAERERVYREQQAARQAAMEAEHARLAAEAERIRHERERIARERQAALTSAPPPVPTIAPKPVAEVAPGVWRNPYIAEAGVPATRTHRTSPALPVRPVAHRRSVRERRFQRAALIASVVTLLAMLAYAAIINVKPTSPISHSMVQNPVEEKTPFGPAQLRNANAAPNPPAQRAVPPAATLPQSNTTPPPAKRHAARKHSGTADSGIAEDEVVIHHYGATKRPPSVQQRAGIRKYSDID